MEYVLYDPTTKCYAFYNQEKGYWGITGKLKDAIKFDSKKKARKAATQYKKPMILQSIGER